MIGGKRPISPSTWFRSRNSYWIKFSSDRSPGVNSHGHMPMQPIGITSMDGQSDKILLCSSIDSNRLSFLQSFSYVEVGRLVHA